MDIGNAYISWGFNTIRFFNPQVGYAAGGNNFGPGNYGSIYKTVDSGKTWQSCSNLGGNHIEFTADSNVIIAGYGGELIKSAVRGFQADSLAVKTDYSCGEVFSASVATALCEADSIAFEIKAPDGSLQYVPANPAYVSNGQATCSASGHGVLAPGTTYSVRLRFLINGVYQYSSTVITTGQGIPQPYIRDSVNALISSATSGNQWYLNGTAVSGATQQRLLPTASGLYTVQVTDGICKSPMSGSIRFVSGNLGVVLFPNPAKDHLTILNTQGRLLDFHIVTMVGTLVYSGSITGHSITIPVNQLAKGQYIVHITERSSGDKTSLLFVKL